MTTCWLVSDLFIGYTLKLCAYLITMVKRESLHKRLIRKGLHDFSCSKPDDMLDEDLAKISRYYKETQEWKLCVR
jgi:hypothetical protein